MVPRVCVGGQQVNSAVNEGIRIFPLATALQSPDDRARQEPPVVPEEKK